MHIRGGRRFTLVQVALVSFLGVTGGTYIFQPSLLDFHKEREDKIKQQQQQKED